MKVGLLWDRKKYIQSAAMHFSEQPAIGLWLGLSNALLCILAAQGLQKWSYKHEWIRDLDFQIFSHQYILSLDSTFIHLWSNIFCTKISSIFSAKNSCYSTKKFFWKLHNWLFSSYRYQPTKTSKQASFSIESVKIRVSGYILAGQRLEQSKTSQIPVLANISVGMFIWMQKPTELHMTHHKIPQLSSQ